MIIILSQVEGIKHLETSIFSIPDLGRSIYTDVIIRYHYLGAAVQTSPWALDV